MKNEFGVLSIYSSHLQIYNSIIHTFHFFTPFLINLISAIILITKKSRQQSNIHKHRTYILKLYQENFHF